jgi:hypothetical protein
MEHSPSWEALRFPTSQEIPCILGNLEDHDHIHKIPSHVLVQGISIQFVTPIQLLEDAPLLS